MGTATGHGKQLRPGFADDGAAGGQNSALGKIINFSDGRNIKSEGLTAQNRNPVRDIKVDLIQTVYHPVNSVNDHVDKADDTIKGSLCNRHESRKDALKDFLHTRPRPFPIPGEYTADKVDNSIKYSLDGIPNRFNGCEKGVKDFAENTKGLRPVSSKYTLQEVVYALQNCLYLIALCCNERNKANNSSNKQNNRICKQEIDSRSQCRYYSASNKTDSTGYT